MLIDDDRVVIEDCSRFGVEFRAARVEDRQIAPQAREVARVVLVGGEDVDGAMIRIERVVAVELQEHAEPRQEAYEEDRAHDDREDRAGRNVSSSIIRDHRTTAHGILAVLNNSAVRSIGVAVVSSISMGPPSQPSASTHSIIIIALARTDQK